MDRRKFAAKAATVLAVLPFLRFAQVKATPAKETSQAFLILKRSLQEDSDYAWAWHSNIACAAMDEGLDHAAANRAAARFMRACFQLDTTESKQWRDIFSR